MKGRWLFSYSREKDMLTGDCFYGKINGGISNYVIDSRNAEWWYDIDGCLLTFSIKGLHTKWDYDLDLVAININRRSNYTIFKSDALKMIEDAVTEEIKDHLVREKELLMKQEFLISDFRKTLLENQEPLGADFEKVLYDNLWDLYVRDEPDPKITRPWWKFWR